MKEFLKQKDKSLIEEYLKLKIDFSIKKEEFLKKK
jgi:hypothetical protein